MMTERILLALAAIGLIVMLWAKHDPVWGRDLDGRYKNSPQRAWFEAQLVPGGPEKGKSCCSTADGQEAQEDIRDGQYWTQWLTFPWMPVPWTVVLTEPNKHGRPVVWWYTKDGLPVIRCYAPGAGI